MNKQRIYAIMLVNFKKSPYFIITKQQSLESWKDERQANWCFCSRANWSFCSRSVCFHGMYHPKIPWKIRSRQPITLSCTPSFARKSKYLQKSQIYTPHYPSNYLIELSNFEIYSKTFHGSLS